MIDKYKNFKFTVFQVVALSFKSFNYAKQFLIVSFIPSLCQNHFAGEKDYKISLVKL